MWLVRYDILNVSELIVVFCGKKEMTPAGCFIVKQSNDSYKGSSNDPTVGYAFPPETLKTLNPFPLGSQIFLFSRENEMVHFKIDAWCNLK